jgi:hypothetical protein
LYSDGAEEHLVEAEDDLGQKGGARRWSRHDVLQAKILHVTNKRTGGTRVGERVTPEEPLEANTARLVSTARDQTGTLHLHSHDGKRLEQKGQRRLATCKARIQEGDTGDDKPDQEPHHNQVEVVKLKSLILGVDILDVGIAAIGLCLVELWLAGY